MDKLDKILELVEKQHKETIDKFTKIEENINLVKKDVNLVKEDLSLVKMDVNLVKEDLNLVKEDVKWIKEQQEENSQILRILEDSRDVHKAILDNIKYNLAEIKGITQKNAMNIEWNSIDIAVLKKAVGNRE